MKKIIALALVLVMALSMTTVAFAATWAVDTTFAPGTEIEFTPASFGLDDTAHTNYFSSDYFTISKVKYAKGADLVESLKFDGDGNLVLTFKKNYSLEAPKIPNFAIDEITLKAIKEIDLADTANDVAKNSTHSLAATGAATIGFDASNTVAEKLDAVTSIDVDSKLHKFEKNNNVSYKDITIKGTDVYVEVRVFDGEKVYLEQTAKADIELVKANADAELTFINFVSAPTFTSNASVEISADKDAFIYEIKDGKLVKTNFKWNDEAYAFTGKTRTLGSYVISDVELKDAVVAEEETKNPNTGANDVVGVAVALAVVSLVAAGAVSLKK